MKINCKTVWPANYVDLLTWQSTEVGLSGHSGEPAVSHAAVDPKSAVAHAPALPHLMAEQHAVGTKPSLRNVIKARVQVSIAFV